MVTTGPGNMTNATGLFTWINSLTNNWFFPGVLISVYLILFIKMLFNPSNTPSKAFATASFMVMVLAIFARTMNFINTSFMALFIVLTAVGGVWMHIENS